MLQWADKSGLIKLTENNGMTAVDWADRSFSQRSWSDWW